VAASVADVAGANARAIRLSAGVTLERLAFAMKLSGLRWSTGRISSFESGHVPARIETLYAVAVALGFAIGRPVRLADLLAGDDEVEINADLRIDSTDLHEAVSGKPVVGETELMRDLRRDATDMTKVAKIAVATEFGEADVRVCRKLKVTPEAGALAMGRIWARPFSRERDRLAGPNANPQRRGQISRELQKQLAEELARGDY
jgi:transcriptional regulator with XRE-family HTH domain